MKYIAFIFFLLVHFTSFGQAEVQRSGNANTVVDYAVNVKGWPASSIVIICPPYMTSAGYANYVGSDGVTVAADVARHEAYVLAVASAAYKKGCRSINVYAEMKNSTSPSDLISGVDGIHPNDSGHAFISNYLINNIF